jgi:hypothetical protein
VCSSDLALPVLLTLGALGCLDIEQDYAINPDGSGKVTIHWIGATMDLGQDKGPDAKARAVLKEEITRAEGVDAWKDVTCVVRDDGKFEFKGTAYFRDISKVKLHSGGFSMLSLKASKDAAGNLVVVETGEKKPGAEPKPLSDEEAKKKIQEERVKFAQMRPLMESMLTDLKVKTTVALPGKVGEATNFRKATDSSVSLSLEGKALLKTLDELAADDAWLRDHSLEGAGAADEALNEKIFGQKGPIQATTTGELKPLFDYETEAGAARPAPDELLKSLGAGPIVIAPPAKGGDFKSLQVAGVRRVYIADSDRGVTPLGQSKPGMTIVFLGELPGSVLSVKEVKLLKAVADTGDDLLPGEDAFNWTQNELSKDKSWVTFEVNLAAPGENVNGLKEVSGTLQYVVGGKTKATDLGIAELKADAKGTGDRKSVV